MLLGLLLALGPACGNGAAPPAPAQPSAEATQAMARARALFAEEKPFEAAAELERAAELAPDWAEAHLSLGKLLLSHSDVRFATATVDRARLERAIEHLERACTLAPRDPEAAYWAGRALAKADRGAEASTRLGRALELDPEHGAARKELGFLLAAEGDTQGAIAELTRARALLPADDELLLRLGLALEGEERLEEARDAYLAARAANPAHPGPSSALAVLYGRLGDPAAAERMRAEFERLRAFGKRLTAALAHQEEHSRDPAACMALAELYLELEAEAQAARWAERALLLDAQHAPALALLRRLGRPVPGEERP